MLESLFNKVASIFIKKRLQHSCLPANIATFLRTPILKYISSSGKYRDPGHFLKSQGKFFLSFLCTLFFIFLTPKKLQIETLKSFLGPSISHYYHFSIYILFEPFLVKKEILIYHYYYFHVPFWVYFS